MKHLTMQVIKPTTIRIILSILRFLKIGPSSIYIDIQNAFRILGLGPNNYRLNMVRELGVFPSRPPNLWFNLLVQIRFLMQALNMWRMISILLREKVARRDLVVQISFQ